MKKRIALALCLCICLSLLAGCSKAPASTEPAATKAAPAQSTPAETTAPPAHVTSQEAIDALDGKRILFIGNSYTFFGHCVMYKSYGILQQRERSHDTGLFYQLCKANGIDVEVTNWTFGGHDITDHFGGSCTIQKECYGVDHAQYMVDPVFDYVAIQPYVEDLYTEDFVSYLRIATDRFREANPDVKFLLLVPHMAMERSYKWIAELEQMDEAGFIVCNWGGMLDDIVNKRVQVPGATQPYARPTFVVSVDQKDGHHQNLLVGYLTALMTYCAITGESAVGQPYDFVDDPTIHPEFDMEAYQAKYYTYEPYTNFVEVYRSSADMNGLQTLIDQYIAKFNGGN